MPTPNWGPQAGTPMDQATFDAYVASNPPGTATNNVYWGGNSPTGGSAAAAPDYWSQFYLNGPASVQVPQYQTANQDQARAQQQQVIQDLQRQAMGDPNSRAQQQLQQGYGQAQAQQASLGSTMRGQSAGASMRGIQAGQQDIQRGLAGDQQMLQLQEQQAAQQMLAQLLAQQQGQDITQAQGMANTALGAQSLDEAMRQFYAQQGSRYNVEQGQIQGERGRAQLGFDLEGADITNRLIRQGVNAAATGLSTWAQQPKSSQQTIDDAFNG